MSTESTASPTNVSEPKPTDKELNFRQLEAKYERIVSQERAEKERMARELDEIKRSKVTHSEEDEDDAEPYVDKKKLKKTLKNFEKDIDEKIDKRSEEKAHRLLEEREQAMWLEANPDFYDVVQSQAQRFFEKAPKLAEAILRMPDNFDRKKLVYHNIKSLGLDRPDVKQPSIQDKVDANKRSPYYQPSGMGTAPYAQSGDFSDAGKKNAWEQMQKLKANLRLG